MALTLTARISAYLKNLAARGDMVAKAIVEDALDVKMTAAAEAANSITVTGQVTDGVGNPKAGTFNVLLTSVPVAGTGALTDGGNGTMPAGSGTKQAWMQTASDGTFQVAVANINAENNLLVAQVEDGQANMIVLTFA